MRRQEADPRQGSPFDSLKSNKFDVIAADSPWEFRTYSARGKGRSAERHYPVMSIEAICSLPVKDIAADNAVLFLWVTWPTMFAYAPRVIEAWGFEYRAKAFTWVKTNRRSGGYFMGNGYYTRANDEACLLCVKKGGRAPVADRGVRSLIVSPIGRHSEKPAEFYERVERLYPVGRRLEMFARERREGWTGVGNEIDGRDIGDALRSLLS